MHLALVSLLALTIAACAPAPSLDAEASADTLAADQPLPAPTFVLLGAAPRYQAVATFRDTLGVALGDTAAVFEIGKASYRAPLADGPSQFQEPGGTVVTQATYALDRASYSALTTTPADSVAVRLWVGGTRRAFPFTRGDLME